LSDDPDALYSFPVHRATPKFPSDLRIPAVPFPTFWKVLSEVSFPFHSGGWPISAIRSFQSIGNRPLLDQSVRSCFRRFHLEFVKLSHLFPVNTETGSVQTDSFFAMARRATVLFFLLPLAPLPPPQDLIRLVISNPHRWMNSPFSAFIRHLSRTFD